MVLSQSAPPPPPPPSDPSRNHWKRFQMGILFHLHRVGTGDALLPWMIPPSLTKFSDPIPHLFVAPLTGGSNPLWKGRKNVADRDLRDEGMTSFPGTGRGGRAHRVHPSGAKPGRCALASPQPHTPFPGSYLPHLGATQRKLACHLGAFPHQGALVSSR